MEILIYISTDLHRLTLGQYGKAFGLSATPVAFVCYAIDWRAFSITLTSSHIKNWTET